MDDHEFVASEYLVCAGYSDYGHSVEPSDECAYRDPLPGFLAHFHTLSHIAVVEESDRE